MNAPADHSTPRPPATPGPGTPPACAGGGTHGAEGSAGATVGVVAAGTPVPPVRPRRSGVVIPQEANWAGRATARLIYSSIRTVDATLRYRVEYWGDAEATIQAGPAIFVIWHNRLALSLRLHTRFIQARRPRSRLAAIVSASRDGGMLARVLELFGVEPVRGSSSRRGAQALREMTAWARKGFDLAITPDGPRGPRYVLQDGAVDVSALTGLPIVPASFDLSRRGELRSWDRFQIPVPFARCRAVFGEPVRVPRELDPARREQYRLEVQRRLLAISHETATLASNQ